MTPLRGARILLRPLRDADLDAVFELLHDEETTASVSWRQPTRESTKVWLARRIADQRECGVSLWGAELLATAELVGLCGFFPRHASRWELGYVIHARHWRQGFATEAAALAVGFAFTAGREVVATIRPENAASRRVADRVGLRLADHQHDTKGELLLYLGKG